MREQLTIDLNDIREMRGSATEEGVAAPLGHLAARIARRPGRWRERMAARHDIEEERLLPEAA